eukprot:3970586-Alexandrium_andersonii.AAC.1
MELEKVCAAYLVYDGDCPAEVAKKRLRIVCCNWYCRVVYESRFGDLTLCFGLALLGEDACALD